MAEENRTAEYTDLQLQFLNLVSKYPVKNPETIVDYVSSQGEDILENPEKLATSLAECEITPVRRRQILKHWFADKGVEIPPEVLKRAVLPPQERRRLEREEIEERERQVAKYGVDEDGVIKVATTSEKALTWLEAKELSKAIKKELAEKGVKKVSYIFDVEKNGVRMARGDEVGGTLEEAKALKQMAGEGEKGTGESPFIQDAATGIWALNPKARITGLELMAFDAIKRAQEKGEPVDPLETLTQTAEKLKIYREALGGATAALPAWATDPAEFIRIIRTISPEPKADEGLKEQLAALTSTVNELKEEKYRDQITTQQQQIQTLTNKVGELVDTVTELRRPVTGRTEMDIIHEVATEGIGLAKTELSGLRKDIKDALSSGILPPPKTPEEKERRKERFREAIEIDKRLEALGRRVFFGEDIEILPHESKPEKPSKPEEPPKPQSKPPPYVY